MLLGGRNVNLLAVQGREGESGMLIRHSEGTMQLISVSNVEEWVAQFEWQDDSGSVPQGRN